MNSESLRLQSLRVANFMRIEALTIDAQGNHVSISGPNGSGKTSAVTAIWTALCGYSAKDIPDPIREGASSGEIQLDLGYYTITRRFTPSGTTLKVTARDGSKITQPQQLLDSLLSEYSLDPVAFLTKRPQDQVDDVLAVAGIKPPVDAVRELTGENIPALPGESADKYLMRLSADQTGEFYLKRRDANRVVETKKKATLEAVAALENIGGRPTLQETPTSTAGLLDELNRIESQRAQYRAMQAHCDSIGSKAKILDEQVKAMRRDHQKKLQQIDETQHEIDRLLAKIKDLKLSAQAQELDIASKQEACDEAMRELEDARAAVASTLNPEQRAAEIRRQLSESEARSKSLAKRQQAAEFCDRMSAEQVFAEEDAARLDSTLEGLRNLRRHLLDGVNLGIEGLSVADGEVKLNGHSLKQASHAEKMRLACAVAMKQNPTLKLLRVDDGEHLDEDSRMLLMHLANANGWQVIITSVANTQELAVVIEDVET